MQPATEEGQAAYCEQMNTWHQRNGNAQPTKNTGFPLHPGGAQPGLGKCYKCGIAGHQRATCDSKTMILRYEGDFQAICGSILNPRHAPLQVNFIATEAAEFFWADGYVLNNHQGNGEGPSAY